MKNLIGKKKVVVLDGAMGTYLELLGFKERTPEVANLVSPELIKKVHTGYVEAGAEIILTNTFGANGIRLSKHNLDDKIEEINVKGAEVALGVKEKHPDIFVAGDIGPLGEFLQPYGSLSEKEAGRLFLRQGKILEKSGVDLLVLETFSDIKELNIAYVSLKETVSVPVIPCFSLMEGKTYKTLMGQSIEEIVSWAEKEKVEILGVNCGISSEQMKDVIQNIVRLTNVLLWVKPNAGNPTLSYGKIAYVESIEEFGKNCLEIRKIGGNFIGGCCGTTPEYIKFIHNATVKL